MIYKVLYILKKQVNLFVNAIYKFSLRSSGAKIGKNTFFSRLSITWPHKVTIGNNCVLEQNIYFKHDGPYSPGKSILIGNNIFIGTNCEFNIKKKITIGDNVLIASGCKFIDHDHGIDKSKLIRIQDGPEAEITIEEDVWLGTNVIVLKGITIEKGAIIAAGAIVNKNVPSYEIWGGVPAKKIGERK